MEYATKFLEFDSIPFFMSAVIFLLAKAIESRASFLSNSYPVLTFKIRINLPHDLKRYGIHIISW